MLRRLATTLAIAASALGCAAAPLTSPAHGGAAWTAFASRHFVLETDIPPEGARERLLEFECLYDALGTLFARPRVETGTVEIVLFSRWEDFTALTGVEEGLGGYFTEQAPGDLAPQPALVFPDSLVTATQGTFLHEITHRFVRQNFTDPPPWLNEGLAQYFSTLRIEGDRLVVGAHLPELGFTDDFGWSEEWFVQDRHVRLNDASFFEGREGPARYRQQQIPNVEVPSVAELLRTERGGFYAWDKGGSMDEKARHAQEANYGGAWALVHWLLNGTDAAAREHFQAFLAAMASGAKTADAFHATFGGDVASLERPYRAHLHQGTAVVRSLPFARRPAPRIGERAMSNAEIRLLWARHRGRGAAKSAAAARADVADALASEPRSAAALYQRAVFAMADQRYADAARDLDTALAGRPLDPRILAARLQVDERRALASGGAPRAAAAAARPDVLERLSKTARTAAELDAVAYVHALGARAAEGLPFAERAVRADPLCWACEHTRALLLVEAGRLPEAHAAILRALALLPERSPSGPYVELRLAIERSMADPRRRAPPPSPPSPP